MRKVAHLVVALAGLALIGWGIVLAVHPSVTCRGVDMRPGDICHYASPTGVETNRIQTYEERAAAQRTNAPVVMGLGAAIALFGGGLYLQERSRARRSSPPSEILG